MNEVRITECPRDAMQGIAEFIPTESKIKYQNLLLKCGFDILDSGSFVSPKAIPQMRDTAELLDNLDMTNTKTKLLTIVANERGAENAVSFEQVTYLGYPFSISETFQLRNTNATIEQSWGRVSHIAELAAKHNKELLVYLSMGFGNPYGDAWNAEVVFNWAERLNKELGAKIIALSDTVGVATPELVKTLFQSIIPSLPSVEFAAHLHVVPQQAHSIIEAAYQGGCRRFDGAIKGFGGCPMAEDDLTGNMPTELLLSWLDKNKIHHGIDNFLFDNALQLSTNIFPNH